MNDTESLQSYKRVTKNICGNKNGLSQAELWRNPQFRRMSEDTLNGNPDIRILQNLFVTRVCFPEWSNEQRKSVGEKRLPCMCCCFSWDIRTAEKHSIFTAEFTQIFASAKKMRQLSADHRAPSRCFHVCLVASPNRGYCWLLRVHLVSFQLLVSPDMSRHQSRTLV